MQCFEFSVRVGAYRSCLGKVCFDSDSIRGAYIYMYKCICRSGWAQQNPCRRLSRCSRKISGSYSYSPIPPPSFLRMVRGGLKKCLAPWNMDDLKSGLICSRGIRGRSLRGGAWYIPANLPREGYMGAYLLTWRESRVAAGEVKHLDTQYWHRLMLRYVVRPAMVERPRLACIQTWENRELGFFWMKSPETLLWGWLSSLTWLGSDWTPVYHLFISVNRVNKPAPYTLRERSPAWKHWAPATYIIISIPYNKPASNPRPVSLVCGGAQ